MTWLKLSREDNPVLIFRVPGGDLNLRGSPDLYEDLFSDGNY
jgi:hypothetical protein